MDRDSHFVDHNRYADWQWKTPLHTFLIDLLQKGRARQTPKSPNRPWILDRASFEKMGELMSLSNSRLLRCYDELATLLAQMNVYRGKEWWSP